MAWEDYKAIADKFFKNKKLNEGDIVLYKTVDGRWKKTVLKKTLKGRLIIEAAEIRNDKEFVVVSIKELPEEDLIYVPKYEELLEILDKEHIPYEILLELVKEK